jgi:hypothetical protein
VTDRRHTAGRWDPNDRPVYFLASPPRYDLMARVAQDHPYVLVAVNELRPNASGAVPALDNLLASGVNVLLDSGIFWLTNEHMRAHGITMNEALALHPDEIDGFDTLFDNYVAIATRYADDLWGYIELDQGGRERKIETRARLHDLGLDPMPVYHPLNDGADYLDHLFQGYDRFCMGNVVQADRFARVRLFHALWDRHRAHPDTWVHLLGYSPNTAALTFPFDSCDSSSYLEIIRWPASSRVTSMLNAAGSLPTSWWGQPAADAPHHATVQFLSAVIEAHVDARILRLWLDEVRDTLGLDQYSTTPAPAEELTP